ncbi:hypothetical protein RvY_10921 [Ramazzottius varieornatus]|uniref:Uncharacterized protein n=1 Tax=Ramazzottius varieornatus TaxID=947166 RepID=A0A1D1VJT1_RAMVA|nr:hypothetical protein RvY_10921 [Ramazzottius varieornatus]
MFCCYSRLERRRRDFILCAVETLNIMTETAQSVLARRKSVAPDYMNYVEQVSEDPTSGRDWSEEDCRKFVCWLLRDSDLNRPRSSGATRQDMYLLHCLLSTDVYHIDGLLLPTEDGVIETALSLAVSKNDTVLIKYLLKMGASADVLIGPVSSAFNKPSLYASDRPCPTYPSLLIQYGRRPKRRPLQPETQLAEIENNLVDHVAYLEAIQTNQVIHPFDKGIEYDMAQVTQNPDVVKTWSRTHRAYVYARLNQRRPNGPKVGEFNRLDIFLTYKGDISVNSYLIDELIERKNALHEAIARKNLSFLEWLLKEKHADPNTLNYTANLLFDEVVSESSPIEQTLRGFLVWDENESKLVGRMMDMLLDHGSVMNEQRAALIRILRDSSSLHMVCMEMLHFIRMTQRLLDRSPGVLTEELSHEFNAGFPLLVRSCEKKWFEEAIDIGQSDDRMNLILLEAPAFLLRVTPPCQFTLRPDTFRTLTIYRSYRTLAVLFSTYGGRLSSVEAFRLMINVPPSNMEPIYCYAHQMKRSPMQGVIYLHNRRALALVVIMARLFPPTQSVREFLVQYYRVLIGDQNVMLPESLFKLTNRCVSVLKQQVLTGKMTEIYVASRLPPTLYYDIYHSGTECSTLAIYDPNTLF